MRVGIVGAGLAGLAAGCELADLGHDVTLFEKRPFAGGKAYSFVDPVTGCSADNGQHVFMRCTTAYTAFLEKLGTLQLTRRQRRLSVKVSNAEGRQHTIRSVPLPAPLHLLPSFACYGHLSMGARVRAGRAMLVAWRMTEASRLQLWTTSFHEWLREHGQRPSDIERFWDFLLLPTLNARSREVSATDALFVLRRGFLASAESAAIGVSTVPLTEIHARPAIEYIERRGGEFRGGQNVVRLCADGRAGSVQMADGHDETFDAVICATGHRQALGLLPMPVRGTAEFRDLERLPTAPIINLHFWFARPVPSFSMRTFVGTELQWIFNRTHIEGSDCQGQRTHLVLSLSGAQEYMALTRSELEQRFVPLMRRYIDGIGDAPLIQFMAIKEPEATFVPAPGIRRPPNATTIRNLAVAGAYTATGWPATMESAVRSGIAAARVIQDQCIRGPANRA